MPAVASTWVPIFRGTTCSLLHLQFLPISQSSSITQFTVLKRLSWCYKKLLSPHPPLPWSPVTQWQGQEMPSLCDLQHFSLDKFPIPLGDGPRKFLSLYPPQLFASLQVLAFCIYMGLSSKDIDWLLIPLLPPRNYCLPAIPLSNVLAPASSSATYLHAHIPPTHCFHKFSVLLCTPPLFFYPQGRRFYYYSLVSVQINGQKSKHFIFKLMQIVTSDAKQVNFHKISYC